jgi:hypothetical protein
MTSGYGPVTDWANDIDHAEPEYNERAHEIWDELRDAGCPVAHTDRYGGMWAPLTHELVKEVAYDTDNFTSRGVVVNTGRPIAEAPVGPAPPITSDPPFHQHARRLLLPPFSPKSIDPWEPEIRRLCNRLLDEMGEITPGETVVDAAIQYAQHIPVNVISRMLGFPVDDDDYFRRCVHEFLELVNIPVEEREQSDLDLDGYLDRQIEEHRQDPRDDLTTYLLNAEIGGNKLSHEHVRGSMVLLLIAGIDTTWSGIGSCIWHLAKTPEDRRRLVAEPSLMPTAIEEFLRAYAPVTMAREIVKETQINGCTFKPGQMVMLSFPAANRDPDMFEDADKVVIDRKENRHAAFGLGIHRCVGSNLARMEMTVAVEELLKRIPEFSLAGDLTWSEGTVRGPRRLPIKFR